ERSLAFLDQLQRWLGVAVLVLGVLAALMGAQWALQLDPEDLRSGWAIARTKALRGGFIVFLAVLARPALTVRVDPFASYLRRRGGQNRDEEVRLNTLCSVLTGAGAVMIYVVSGFLVLETVLESVGTILASVGFLGIAVGFGAQTLVRDLISG